MSVGELRPRLTTGAAMGLKIWMTGVARGLRAFTRRMGDDARGNVAMLFALSMPILVLMTLGGVDIHRASTVRVNLQDALDAAALAAARSPYTAEAELRQVGLDSLRANLKAYPDITLLEGDTTFTLVDGEVIVASARVNVKTLVANIVLPPYGQFMNDDLPVGAHSEVNRATRDLEVSLVLDITGSMEGDRLKDLQEAANDLVDLVVQDNQAINRTRMALVPYSMGVNAGTTYLDAVRGAARGPTNITAAAWATPSSQKTISAISKASPGQLSANAHGYETGDIVWMSGVAGSGNGTDLAGRFPTGMYRVVKVNDAKFSVQRLVSGTWTGVSTTGTQNYTANSGKTTKCQIATCEVVVTSANHGLTTGEDVRILGVGGMTQINTQNNVAPDTRSGQPPFYLTVTRQSNTAFSINGVVGPAVPVTNYSSGGNVQCLSFTCQKYMFTNNNNQRRIYDASNCVSERVGANAYTDVAASTTPVAFSYVDPGAAVTSGGCMTSTFTPLTTDRGTLHGKINGYKAEGGTAGQIGVGWGWYMVSPTFASIFPAASRPDPYNTPELLKVVIIMTDGEFNAVYYNGVRARDSGSGGGSNDRWINHDSNNGSPFLQAVSMCTAMKAKNIIIYTVGFDIGSADDATPNTVDSAREVMQRCATDSDHVYLPQNGSSLRSAFAAIGRSISQLRISK